MKIAPLYHALTKESWARPIIVHTGQHYDVNMSGAFFDDLGLPKPHISLGVGSGSHAEQTARIMVAYEQVLQSQSPDLVVVVGDVNSTLASTLAASKLGIKVAHLEAGLRSFDRSMPEEINRLVTDVLADFLWVPSRDAIANLLAEGVPPSKIAFVGNIMIDSLEMLRDKIECKQTYAEYGQAVRGYGVVTLHRPSNVDDVNVFRRVCELLENISETIPLVFPVHPRARCQIDNLGLFATKGSSGRMILPGPLNYISFLSLVMNCRFVITDSGGIQEETSYLGIPCLTLRDNTERPITVTQGTNRLCAPSDVPRLVDEILRTNARKDPRIEFWDGRSAGRVVEAIRRDLSTVMKPTAGRAEWRFRRVESDCRPL